jgi:hypothetical protein
LCLKHGIVSKFFDKKESGGTRLYTADTAKTYEIKPDGSN